MTNEVPQGLTLEKIMTVGGAVCLGSLSPSSLKPSSLHHRRPTLWQGALQPSTLNAWEETSQ